MHAHSSTFMTYREV